MQDNEKKPALRFKGFTDPWEQRKLIDEVTSIDTGKSKFTPQKSGVYEILGSTSVIGYDDSYDYEGDFLLTARVGANAGELYRHSGKVKISDNTVFIKGEQLDFIYYALLHFDIKRLSFGTGQPLVKASELKTQDIMMPVDSDERSAISTYFSNLDHLITLHQRKYEKLVNIKKSMLDKMFPQNGASVPEIRFKGFTDPWEQRKLGDAFERVVRKNTNNESRLPLTISAQDGLVDQITYFNNRVASRDVSNYYLVYNGEFAYNKSTSDGYPFGAVKRLDWYEKGVLSTLYIVFALKHPEKDDSDFMTVFYDTDRWHRGVAERAAEGARNHGLLNISADDFFDIDTTMPEDKVEQEKIGRLLKKLDTLITLHQRKLEKLQNIKKSCLEKMFV